MVFIFLSEAILFFLTILLGIFCAINTQKVFIIQKIEPSTTSFFQFIFYFFLATVFVFLIFQFVKNRKIKGKIYKILFGFISFIGSFGFFSSFLPALISLILVFLLICWWVKKSTILNQNLLMIFSLAGIGATIGLTLKPNVVIFILIVLSIYDIIAVYQTKHMVKIAKEMIESGTILGLIFPFTFSDFLKTTKEIPFKKEKFLILGGGDIALPLIFSVSLLEFGVFKSFLVSLFSFFGLFADFLFFIKQKERKPIPALPLISLFSIIGYFLVSIL